MSKNENDQFTIGGRTYEVLNVHSDTPIIFTQNHMIELGNNLNANMGKEDGEFILKNASDLPPKIRKVKLEFPEWLDTSSYGEKKDNHYLSYCDGSVRMIDDGIRDGLPRRPRYHKPEKGWHLRSVPAFNARFNNWRLVRRCA